MAYVFAGICGVTAQDLRQGRGAFMAKSWPRAIPATATQPDRHDTTMNMQSAMPIAFQRAELMLILGLYGRMVSAGEWRDYGISTLRDYAVFSIFRRSAEQPIYRIEKHPRLRLRQGQYQIIGMDGQILKRGDDLRQVLAVLERKMIRLVEK
jgi:hypothetical protein